MALGAFPIEDLATRKTPLRPWELWLARQQAKQWQEGEILNRSNTHYDNIVSRNSATLRVQAGLLTPA
jgi:hypothetical protein